MFDILRANHLLISSKRPYRVTTNSHHRFRKHKNLVEGIEPVRPEEIGVKEILKQEFLLKDLDLSLTEMKRVIKDAVYKYNHLRPHYSCEYKTPEYMHQQRLIKIKKYKKHTA